LALARRALPLKVQRRVMFRDICRKRPEQSYFLEVSAPIQRLYHSIEWPGWTTRIIFVAGDKKLEATKQNRKLKS
jgi:hypothetical protein